MCAVLYRRDKARLWIFRHIPRWLRTHDFEAFISLLCFLAGVPLLFSTEYGADSVESLLPLWAVKVWASVLTVCPVFIILGLFMSSRVRFPARMVWLRLEVLGLTGLSYVGYMYFFAILTYAPYTRWVSAMIVLAFALTCHTREITLQVRIISYRVGVGLDERP